MISTKTAHDMRALVAIDAYKIDHRRQYPEGTEYVYSNFTPRGSRIDGVDKVVFFGLQAFLKSYCEEAWGDFFSGNINKIAKAYKETIDGILGPNTVGVEHIRALHALGYLPLQFNALPEGTRVPLRIPFFTVENTHPDFFWLVNYIESVLSSEIWLPATSATQAFRLRTLLNQWAFTTGASTDAVAFQGHDFSLRGMENMNAAAASGAGHLLAFTGSDSLPAGSWIDKYYPGDNGFVMGSVPATEHSVMCAGGELNERETFEKILDLYPEGIVSVVSDTYDFWSVLNGLLPSIKDKVMARNGKLVIRPDSGDPIKIICGDPDAPETFSEHFGAVETLDAVFGSTINEAGYKELDSHIGLIYGDSITYDRANEISHKLAAKGYASTNVVFGVGSFTYQHVTRDTFGFAMKATWVQINGEAKNIFKKPKTDDGLKNSAKGKLVIIEDEDGELKLLEQATDEELRSFNRDGTNLLVPIWKNGNSLRTQSFADVRKVLNG